MGTGDLDGNINVDDDPQLTMFKTGPPRNAVIQVVDQSGDVLEAKTLQRPLAKLRAEHLYADSRLTYLVTVDYSAGFGSYSGPITNLVEVKRGHLRWIDSTETKTGSIGTISLMESRRQLGNFWMRSDGKGKQILLARCRPDWYSDKNDPDFRTTYARFFFDGTKWLVVERTVKGISEFDHGFPSRKHFP